MDNKYNILDKIEDNLIQNKENIKIKNKQLIDFENRFKDLINEKQRIEKLYETEVERGEQLKNELIKCRFDSKIAIEKEMFQLREENNQYLAQIETLNNQLIAIKNDFNSLQLIRLNLEQELSHISDNYRNEKFFINNMSSQIIQINNKTESVAQYISSVESLHNELKNSVKIAIETNLELRQIVKQQNEDLIIAQNEISSLRQQLVEFSSKSLNTQKVTNHKDLHSLQLNKENQLQKEEIIKLKEILEQTRNENKCLINLLTESNVNLNKE